MNDQPPIALTIASSDSGGGAGVQADLKAFARCGVHGTSVIVALTAQNTTGVSAIHQCPPDFVAEQVRAVFADLRPAGIKLGMLFSAEIVTAVAQALSEQDLAGISIVVDPVMIASSGARLLQPDAVDALITQIFPLARVVTPNLMEAQALTGLPSEDRADLAKALVALGAQGAVVTGGHGAVAVDHLFDGVTHWELPVARHAVAATHGAGCTHSAALAACLARGDDLVTAARRASRVAGDAVAHGLVGLGAGDGPVDALNVRALAPPSAE
jgi:hydroxymethylpyrimidine/phosphomethylpyrimidine kinase